MSIRLKKKCVLVTGAGGFIGSHLCERLVEKGYKVKAFLRYNSRNSWGWLENSDYRNAIEIICGDVRDSDGLRYVMEDVDIILHLAALIGIPYSYYSPQAYVDTNIGGTLNILQIAKDMNVKKIVHTSTSEVYGTAQFVPISEKHSINPQSPYAATKSAADWLALSFYRSFNLPVTVIRPFNTYGPRQSARAVIPTIITQILSGNTTIKLGSVYPTRDLTFVKDTIEGFIMAAECEKSVGEVINIGSGFEISVGDLADLIAKLMGTKIKIETDKKRQRPIKSEVGRLWAETKKAKKLLGWSIKYVLEEGLKETIDWLKKHNNSYKLDTYNI